MVKSTIKVTLVIIASMLILACNAMNQVDLEIEIDATLDGKPVAEAAVFLDGSQVGTTDANGQFRQRMKRQPGQEVQLSVQKTAEGYRIDPWKETFVTRLAKNKSVEKYPFAVELKATKFFTVVVIDDESGELLEEATIKVSNKTAGTTNVSGEYVHEYSRMPKKGLKLRIAKKGYGEWRKSVRAHRGSALK